MLVSIRNVKWFVAFVRRTICNIPLFFAIDNSLLIDAGIINQRHYTLRFFFFDDDESSFSSSVEVSQVQLFFLFSLQFYQSNYLNE